MPIGIRETYQYDKLLDGIARYVKVDDSYIVIKRELDLVYPKQIKINIFGLWEDEIEEDDSFDLLKRFKFLF